MASQLSNLPSVRKQHLLVEFASLKYACPEGIYLSLIPGDPTAWSGVCFVRKGPYVPATLRFRISFPPTYPALPPLITFTTDIFHPLITPLTTYTYTTGSSSNETVSARDDERLPSGSFSLRDGFPQWFGRSQRPAEESTPSPSDASGSLKPSNGGSDPQAQTLANSRTASVLSSRSSVASETPRSAAGHTPRLPRKRGVSVVEVLHYMRSSFENEMVLDSLPLEAAGNPGAWHAWRSHRVRGGHTIGALAPNKREESVPSEVSGDEARPAGYQRLASGRSAFGTRRPGEWSWDGVWEERVRRGIDQSNSDAVLYGNSGGSDELIRFLNMNGDMIATVKEDMRRNINVAAAS